MVGIITSFCVKSMNAKKVRMLSVLKLKIKTCSETILKLTGVNTWTKLLHPIKFQSLCKMRILQVPSSICS